MKKTPRLNFKFPRIDQKATPAKPAAPAAQLDPALKDQGIAKANEFIKTSGIPREEFVRVGKEAELILTGKKKISDVSALKTYVKDGKPDVQLLTTIAMIGQVAQGL